MPQSWPRLSVAALLAGAAARRTPARSSESNAERVSGCFRRIYDDGPPGSGAGGVWYTLTTDAGATTMLEVSPSLLAAAGGPTTLGGARVSVVLGPARASSDARVPTVRVREIRREPDASVTRC